MLESRTEQTLGELFKCSIDIEERAFNLYEQLSKLFSHVQEVSAFWDGLAIDELEHMKMLKDIYTSLTQEQLLSPADKEIWENVINIQFLLNKDLIGPINNLDDAYELAHELEFSEVNNIFKFLTIEVVPFEEQKKIVIANINRHQQKLIDFSQNFGDKLWREQIKIQST